MAISQISNKCTPRARYCINGKLIQTFFKWNLNYKNSSPFQIPYLKFKLYKKIIEQFQTIQKIKLRKIF